MPINSLNLVFLAATIWGANGSVSKSVMNTQDAYKPKFIRKPVIRHLPRITKQKQTVSVSAKKRTGTGRSARADSSKSQAKSVIVRRGKVRRSTTSRAFKSAFISARVCDGGDCHEQAQRADAQNANCDDDAEPAHADAQHNGDVAATVCGNGIREPGESCDDGNEDDGDWCSNECVSTTDPGLPSTVLIEEPFDFGLGSFNLCRPSCSGDQCPTITRGALQLKGRSTSVCLPSIQVAARGKLVEHAFTLDASNGLDLVVMRDWPLNKWRIAINFDDGMIQYQSPRDGQRVGFSVDLSNVRSERQWRVIFDSNLNQTFIVAGDTYLGAVPFPAERVDDMMWTSYTSAQGGEAPTLSHYTVTRFDTAE